jgi:hypothetical protein
MAAIIHDDSPIDQRFFMNPRYLCPIVPAQLSDAVGLLGALALTLDPPQQKPLPSPDDISS